MKSKGITIRVAGESGQGINSIGEILTMALKRAGLYAFGYREYPSLIKGGVASYQIEVTDKESSYIHDSVDILVAIGRNSVYEYLDSVKKGGTIIHSIQGLFLNAEQTKHLEEFDITIHYFDAIKLSEELGDRKVSNVIMLSILWKALGFDKKYLHESLESRYSSKPDILKIDLKAFDSVFENDHLPLSMGKVTKGLKTHKGSNDTSDDLTITGNHALALGALAAGLRAIYSYPMTPASSILSYLAKTAEKTGLLVKQAEDEITAIQMTIGSSFAGTRALVATSGGGFDLMTESLSMAGITETPLVVVLAQRPGPSTGLPTWTSGGDLDVALYAGHGEFPRVVMAASDAVNAYHVIQKAYNISEEYQLPVIVLTDKYIAESLYQVDSFGKNEKIIRGLANQTKIVSDDRYRVTKSGLSKRWIPGASEMTYKANSDEHSYDGSSTEDENMAKDQIDKRAQKLKTLTPTLSEPEYFGPKSPKYCIVSWGSNKSVILGAINDSPRKDSVGYLDYEMIWPLKLDTIQNLIKNKTKLIAIESNSTGQLAKLLQQNIENLSWHSKLLKYDGRPFCVEEIIKFIGELS